MTLLCLTCIHLTDNKILFTTDLLEKSRVVTVGEGERNFHIFYQMLAGMPPKRLQEEFYLVPDPKQYYYLARSSLVKVATINDANDFNEVMRAFKSLNFSEDEQKQVCSSKSKTSSKG